MIESIITAIITGGTCSDWCCLFQQQEFSYNGLEAG